MIKLRSYFFIPALFIFIFPQHLFSQSSASGKWNSEIIKQANTARNETYLSTEEKKVILFLNLARMNPALFAETYLQHYLDSAKVKESKYTLSLKKTMQNTKPLHPYEPKQDLFLAANQHAREMGKKGKIGHDDYEKRSDVILRTYTSTGEACDYGNSDALGIVINLLIDEGVADLGHRKAIISEDFYYAGVSIQTHKTHQFNCVIEFAGKIIPR